MKVEKYVPEKNEYLFEINQEETIEDIKVELTKVGEVKPGYVLLNIGFDYDEKINEGEEKNIGGLKITLLKAYPRKQPSEGYATIKIEKDLITVFN